MIFLKTIFFIFFFSLSFFTYAENGYRFESELEFHHDGSIVEGQLENYSLFTNADVKLLIGFFPKNMLGELKNVSDEEVKNLFLKNAITLDPINNQQNRKVVDFKIIKNGSFTKVVIDYQMKKNNQVWFESSAYVLGSDASSFAVIDFPIGISDSIKKEIKKGIHSFSLQDQKVVEYRTNNKTPDFFDLSKITFNSIASLHASRFARLMSLGSFIITDSFANEAKKVNSCDPKEYIIRGDFSTNKGSALFNFQRLVGDIQNEMSSDNYSEDRVRCLSKFYKKAKDDSSTYWAQRGNKSGCLLPNRSDKCSDKEFNVMNDSIQFLTRIQNSLDSFLRGNPVESINVACQDKKKPVSEQMLAFQKLTANIQQAMCCSSGEDGSSDKGPLYKVLESENDDDFKNKSASYRAEKCLMKTKENNKSFLSGEGLGDCAANLAEGLGTVLKNTIKTAASLFDLQTYVALGKFISNLPDSASNLFNIISEQIATQIYSVTDCMSPYEKKQYMCKMVPQVASMLLAPMAIRKFLSLIVNKAGSSALAQMVGNAVSESKAFQVAKNATVATYNGAVRPALNSRIIKPNVKAIAFALKILGKDVSTPIKDVIISKSKNIAAKVASEAEKTKRRLLERQLARELDKADAPEPTTLAEADAALNSRTGNAPVAAVAVVPNPPTKTVPVLTATSTPEKVPVVKPEAAKAPVALTDDAQNFVNMMDDYNKAAARGDTNTADKLKELMERTSGDLSDSERIAIAMAREAKNGGDPLKIKGDLVKDAHDVGGPNRKLGSYDDKEIALKARKAKEAGLSKDTRRELMNAGVLGGDAASSAVNSAQYISIKVADGSRFPARIVGNDGKNYVVEYLYNDGAGTVSKTRTMALEDLQRLGARTSDTSVKLFNDFDNRPGLNRLMGNMERNLILDRANNRAAAEQVDTQRVAAAQAEAQRVAAQAEAQRVAAQAEAQRVAAQAEAQRVAAAQAEAQKVSAAQAEAQRARAAQAEAERQRDAAIEQARLRQEAKDRLAREAEEARLAKLEQERQDRIAEARKIEEADKARKAKEAEEAKKISDAQAEKARLDRETARRIAAEKAAKEAAEEAARPKNLLEQRAYDAKQPGYVNPYGVAKSNLKYGRTVEVKINTMDGVKKVQGEIVGSYIDPVTNMPSVQIKWKSGVAQRGRTDAGKALHTIDGVSIHDIEKIVP